MNAAALILTVPVTVLLGCSGAGSVAVPPEVPPEVQPELQPELQPAASPIAPPTADVPDVVLVSVDTLRADRLSAWGYERDTSPNLDALAASALRFDRAVAPAPWTLPSVTSLFTGRMPSQHGVVSRDWSLSPSALTLAERAREAGYEAAFFGVNAAFVTGHGLDQGFETWQPFSGLSGRQLNRRVLDFLSARDDPRPLFLVVHYFEPHCRYNPPRDVADRYLPDPATHVPQPLDPADYESMGDCFRLQQPDGSPELDRAIYRARYDAEVREVDRLIGELWGAVAAREPWLGVVADHGEAFWEHGAHGHGSQLYDEQIRVPMLVRPPGGVSPVVVPHAVSTLWLTDAAAAAFTAQPAPPYPPVAFSETDYGGVSLRAAQSVHSKLIRDRSAGSDEGLDLADDPAERSPRSGDGAFAALAAALDEQLAIPAGIAESRDRGDGEAEKLRALGYVE